MRSNLDNYEFDYSFEWQPYKGYDKLEYDIKLKDGTILCNMYPNAGSFHSLVDTPKRDYSEGDVSEIRISVETDGWINPDQWYDKNSEHYKGVSND